MIHLHITGWVIAVILLFVVSSSYKKNPNASGGKIAHMILRLFYLIILFSGASLFFTYVNKPGELFVKVMAGIWVIVAMEMITVKGKQQASNKAWWIQFIIAFVIALILGFVRLPLGVHLVG